MAAGTNETGGVALRPDLAALVAFWQTFTRPGEVYEVRLPKTRRGPVHLFGTAGGYFDNGEAFVKAVAPVTGWDAPGVYITLNPVDPVLLARANNRLVSRLEATTSDGDVIRRRHLLIDVDPKRKAGIMATDAELGAALQTREAIAAYLADALGWGAPLYRLMSGSGGALVYPIDLPNDDAATELVRRCLAALAVVFDSDAVTVDQTVYNAARITRVPGTINAKGDHCPERGRPWRQARAE
jgi:hypothetical protein